MKAAELDKRLKWFDDGLAALQRIYPPADGYICPLCQQGFTRAAVEATVLTAEHVPSGAEGGRAILLTCGVCNNRHGSEIEGKGQMGELYRNFGVPGSEGIPATLEVGGAKARGVLRFDGETFEHGVIAKQNDPREIQVIQDAETVDKIVLTFRYNRELIALAARSRMRAAYLAAFATLGYKYILRTDLDATRNAIEGIGKPAVFALQEDAGAGVVVIDAPDALAGCIAVVWGSSVALLPGTAGDDSVKIAAFTSTDPNGFQPEWSKGWEWPRSAQYLLDV